MNVTNIKLSISRRQLAAVVLLAVILIGGAVGAACVYADRQRYTSLCDAQEHPDTEYVFRTPADGDIGVLLKDHRILVVYESFPAKAADRFVDGRWRGWLDAAYAVADGGGRYIVDPAENRLHSPNSSDAFTLRIDDCKS